MKTRKLIIVCVASMLVARPHATHAQNVAEVSVPTLYVTCGSEDDGGVEGTLTATNGTFDGVIGTLSSNQYLRITASASDLTQVNRNAYSGYVNICESHTTYNIPLLCSSTSKALLRAVPNHPNRYQVSLNLFGMGAQRDPEGLYCTITYRPGH